ncbi:hypothetical protein GUITHDRAFT_144163 [Guillardia theta CCMP2712]|uniref:Ubiquitin-like domain-containing protein n=1 Tax=Guillardia theta (strain CCMP2712) TaxID=905079 RepID=L1IRV7_GUITC|nr:hypothetical protein GUITHDRAFT_144163 [Guillardia theta CCMP2712]EKX38565.1 hypothetical protein GUITHDRAFT_144163 [Guillardia theta CCMP2712]|eukprot:XP_005825545.1 hypothetical protein GUITHDRAFT_144163 [Guillardia theta CCMP2712]
MIEDNVYDPMTVHSGIPIRGPGSLWPTKGSPVTSVLAVSDGPLTTSLPLAQEAAEKEAKKRREQYSEAEDVKANILNRIEKEQRHRLRSFKAGESKGGGKTIQRRPAVVYISFSCSTHETITFPAFAQELLGDVTSRIIRRVPQATSFKLLLNGSPLGLPDHLEGIPLDSSLASLGVEDGEEIQIVGISPHESSWPQYETIRFPLEAFLSDKEWPPCQNFAQEEPLNKLTVGATSKSGMGSAEDNAPSNIVVVVLEGK